MTKTKATPEPQAAQAAPERPAGRVHHLEGQDPVQEAVEAAIAAHNAAVAAARRPPGPIRPDRAEDPQQAAVNAAIHAANGTTP